MEKEYKLPKAFAEKWLTALRSGEYKQAQETLYDPNTKGYCCLGVACRLEYPLHYLKASNGDFAGILQKGTTTDLMKYDLKKIPKVLKTSSNSSNLVGELTGMNDDGCTFEEIADWIEDNVEFYE